MRASGNQKLIFEWSVKVPKENLIIKVKALNKAWRSAVSVDGCDHCSFILESCKRSGEGEHCHSKERHQFGQLTLVSKPVAFKIQQI
jgi:hypothetical protein